MIEAIQETEETVYQKKRFQRQGRRALKQMVTERDAMLRGIRQRMDDADNRILELEGQLKEAAKREVAARAVAEARQADQEIIARLEARREELERELSRLQDALREEKGRAARELARIEAERAEVAAAYDELRREQGEREAETARLAQERMELAAAVEEIRREREVLADRVAGYEDDVRRLQARVDELEAVPPPPPFQEVIERFLDDELRAILHSARESAARMLEAAEAESGEQRGEAWRLWREVQSEVDRYRAWREQADPALEAVRSRVDEVGALIAGVPDQIQAALAPVAQAFSMVGDDMVALKAALVPPILDEPPGVAPEDGGQPEREPAGGPEVSASEPERSFETEHVSESGFDATEDEAEHGFELRFEAPEDEVDDRPSASDEALEDPYEDSQSVVWHEIEADDARYGHETAEEAQAAEEGSFASIWRDLAAS